MGVIESFPELRQIELRRSLEKKLDDARHITNKLISNPNELKSVILPYFFQTYDDHEAVSLENAIDIAHPYYSTGELSMRDNGDTYLVHPIQAAIILKETGAKLPKLIAELLHDVIENNPNKKKEIIAKIYAKQLDESLSDILIMTPSYDVKDSRLKKELTHKAILEGAMYDPQKWLFGMKSSDRLTNLPTLNYMKPKEGRTAQERKQGVIYDTKKNILPLAMEFDKVSGAELKLYPYMLDILKMYESPSDYMSKIREILSGKIFYSQREKPIFASSPE